MYGSITKQGGAYQVTVNLLDIKRKHKDNTTVLIPIAESSGTAVKAWAKKIYSSLTGQVDTCSLVIKTTGGVDKGTILINNEPKGNISAGSGEVKGLAEGKYAVAVDAKDFKRFESPNVNCVAGQTVTINPDMAKIDLSLGNGNGSGSGSGSDGGMGLGSGSGSGETGTVTHPKSNKGIWKAVAWGALAGTALAGGAWAYGYFVDESPYRGKTWEITDANGTITVPGMINGQAAQVPKIFDESQCSQTGTLSANDTTGLTTTMNPPPKWDRAPWGNNQFKKACTGYSITKFAVPLTFGLAAVAIGGFIMAARAPDKESPVQVSRTGGTPSASNGHRVKRQPFVIVPVVGPNGGGATFAMEW
jgi:hypothetical protein